MSAAGWARGRILAALAFLAWLDDRGTTLGAATQADVDDWLHGATQQHYLLRDFLTWASARRLADKITVPALPRSELAGLITEDSGWQLLSRCLRDPGIPLDVRPPERSCCSMASSSHAWPGSPPPTSSSTAPMRAFTASGLRLCSGCSISNMPGPGSLARGACRWTRLRGRPPPDERSGSGPAPASGRRPALPRL